MFSPCGFVPRGQDSRDMLREEGERDMTMMMMLLYGWTESVKLVGIYLWISNSKENSVCR